MKKLILLFIVFTFALSVFAEEPPEGSFSWGLTVPLQMDYLSSQTLSVTSGTFTQYNVTYQLVDPTMAYYLGINGDVVTVLNHYAGDSELTQGKIYIKAVISGIPGYDDTELITYVKTRKIYPSLQWNCTVTDMLCGSSTQLSALHGNTDKPNMKVTFMAADDISNPSRRVSIDQTTNTMTATNVGNGIYVIASIDSSENYKATSISYLRDDSIVRFNVVKGYRTISWDSTDFRSIDNLSGNLPLRVTYQDSDDPVTIVSDNPLIAEVMPGNILHIYQSGNVRLTASVAGTDNYYDAVSDTVINIPAALPVVTWEEKVISDMEKQGVVSSTTCGFNLDVWVNSNYGDEADYLFSIPADEQNIAQVIGDSSLCCFADGKIHLSVVARAAGRTSQPSSHEITIAIGRLDFVKSGYWNDTTCWSRADLARHPENYYVDITSNCVIGNGTQANCRGLRIYANGMLTVEPQATLIVDQDIENFGGEKCFFLKADRQNAAQVFMAGGSPSASVEMYLDHSLVNGRDTVWCSHGVPVDMGTLRSNTGKLRVKSWNGGWNIKYGNKISLNAFEGYLITDTLPGIYTVDGHLLCGDHTFSLTRSSGEDEKVGRNFLTNSYTAPVTISSLQFEEMNSELFWYVNGHYLTLPKFSASTMGYGEWRSGQSLFVKALSNDSKLKVDYKDAVMGEADNVQLNMLKISVSARSGYSDTLVLMDAPFCSEFYDDGYDGTKWAGDTCMPQLYANTEWGRAFVNVDSSLVGQRIGFKAARDGETYTIKFNTQAIGNSYEKLYLFDTKTQQFIDITAGDTYSFQGSTLGEDDRFTIMRDKVEAKKDKYGRSIVVIGKKVLLVGFENSDTPVRVMTLDGKVVCEYNTKDGPWLELPDLVTGIYVINAEKCSTKFYR